MRRDDRLRMIGDLLTRWTIRIALGCWVAGCGLEMSRDNTRRGPLQMWLWVVGCVFYWLHVLAAYHYFHDWSQQAAFESVRQQSAEVVGVGFGYGIIFNWLFGFVWIADCLWLWLRHRSVGRETNEPRGNRWHIAAQAFMLFMWLNGAIVFATGAIRWVSIGLFTALIVRFVLTRKQWSMKLDNRDGAAPDRK